MRIGGKSAKGGRDSDVLSIWKSHAVHCCSVCLSSIKNLSLWQNRNLNKFTFFQIKDLEFLKIIHNFATASMPKPYLLVGVLGMWAYFTEKSVTWRFVLDSSESGSSSNQSWTMQQWRSWVCYIRTEKASIYYRLVTDGTCISHTAWASALLVLTGWAMPEPRNVGRVTRELPTLFVCIWTNLI